MLLNPYVGTTTLFRQRVLMGQSCIASGGRARLDEYAYNKCHQKKAQREARLYGKYREKAPQFLSMHTGSAPLATVDNQLFRFLVQASSWNLVTLVIQAQTNIMSTVIRALSDACKSNIATIFK
jgi:hypothetical protein